jgi:alkyl hydroperoxide reductase subunit AhpC
MTMLGLDLESEKRAERELHDALNGDWALLFSHPQDFEPAPSHMQRWLEQLQYELNARRVRAIEVRRERGASAASWIDQLQRNPELVRLREPPFAAADPISFAARALRGELLTQQCGSVLIIDGALKRRGVLRYSAGRSDVSVFDLLASIDALRRPQKLGKAA